MRRIPCFLLTVLLGLTVASTGARAQPLVAPTEAIPAEEQLKQFHLPPGFKIELIASDPVIRKPMNLKFDAAGRLFVTQSIEYPWPAKEGDAPRDTVMVFVDSNDDGVPDKPSVFASGLNIPIGVVPLHRQVLAYSIPTLDQFPDADDDGVADGRRELYRRFGYVDTHGMCSSLNWWIDGWVYGTHGFRNESDVVGNDGKMVKMQSGNTYRLRPDGSHIEQITWGQVNPFGMTVDPFGQFYTSDCHTKPAYQLIRGAYYPSFGKPHDGLGFGPELMDHLHGSTGIAGIVYYAANQFPAEYRDGLLIGNPVTGRINRDTLKWAGASARAIEQPDFLWCDDPWFRPVDLQLAPDGSLYVADFYNCIIGHYEVPLEHPRRDREKGRIWRISYVGENAASGKTSKAPSPAKADLPMLLDMLGDANLVLRTQATHQLVERIGAPAVEPLRSMLAGESPTAVARAHALWALERLGGMTDELLKKASQHGDPLVRVHAVKLIGERANWSPADQTIVEIALFDPDARVKRAAVEAIPRASSPEQMMRLKQLLQSIPDNDPVLRHATRIALRDMARTSNYWKELGLDARDSPATELKMVEIALGEATADAARYQLSRLMFDRGELGPLFEVVLHMGRHLPADDWAKVADLAPRYQQQSPDRQAVFLRAYHQTVREKNRPWPEAVAAWANQLAGEWLAKADEGSNRAGLDFARELGLGAQAARCIELAGPKSPHPALRQPALDALAAVSSEQLVRTAAAVLTTDGEPLPLRQHAAHLMGASRRPDALDLLVKSFAQASQSVAEGIARGLANSRDGGVLLLTAVEQGKASARLLHDQTVKQRLQAAQVPDAAARIDRLTANLPPEEERLKAMQRERSGKFAAAMHDVDRGLAVFKQHCAACHRLNNEGKKVGPELDGIGVRGLDRLLEDTLDPNRNVDGAFRATIVLTTGGQVMQGLAQREENGSLLLVDELGKEQVIPLTEIEERKVSPLSPMPANLMDKIPEADYFHLMSLLLKQKPTSPPSQ